MHESVLDGSQREDRRVVKKASPRAKQPAVSVFTEQRSSVTASNPLSAAHRNQGSLPASL
jgi:hypothetical protein